MNTKKVIKYQINEFKMATLVFFIVVLCAMLLIGISLVNIGSGGDGEESNMLGGMEIGIIIFLFIVGLNSFRETFRLMIQNGVSRKTMFKGVAAATAIIAVVMSLINEIVLIAGRAFASTREGLLFKGTFEQMYELRYSGGGSGFQMALEGILFLICISAAAMMFGFFITTMYYRLNKPAKIVVSVCVPVSIIIIFPLLDFSLTGGRISNALVNLILFAFGFQNGNNPYFGMVTCLLSFGLCAVLSWLLMRRAAVKD